MLITPNLYGLNSLTKFISLYKRDLVSIKIVKFLGFGQRLWVSSTICTIRISSLPPLRSKSIMVKAQSCGLMFGHAIPLSNRSSLVYTSHTFIMIVRCMIMEFGLDLDVVKKYQWWCYLSSAR